MGGGHEASCTLIGIVLTEESRIVEPEIQDLAPLSPHIRNGRPLVDHSDSAYSVGAVSSASLTLSSGSRDRPHGASCLARYSMPRSIVLHFRKYPAIERVDIGVFEGLGGLNQDGSSKAQRIPTPLRNPTRITGKRHRCILPHPYAAEGAIHGDLSRMRLATCRDKVRPPYRPRVLRIIGRLQQCCERQLTSDLDDKF